MIAEKEEVIRMNVVVQGERVVPLHYPPFKGAAPRRAEIARSRGVRMREGDVVKGSGVNVARGPRI